jgi:hypothetical protein
LPDSFFVPLVVTIGGFVARLLTRQSRPLTRYLPKVDRAALCPVNFAGCVANWTGRHWPGMRRNHEPVTDRGSKTFFGKFWKAVLTRFFATAILCNMTNKQLKHVNVIRAAEMLDCSRQNVMYLLAKGRLAGWQVNRKCWAVEVSSIEQYKKEKAK